MSIFRIRKRVNPYTQIDNALINDTRISSDAFRILIYLISKPMDWEISMKQVQDTFCFGRDKMRAAIKNLEQLGYLVRIKPQNEQGQFIGTSWDVTDEPDNKTADYRDNRLTENPTVGKPVGQYTNKEYNKYRERALSEKPQPMQEIPSQFKEEKSAAGRGQAAATYYEKTQYVTNGTEGDIKDVTETAQDASVMPNSQREAYRTDSELRTIMAAYYKANPAEYTVGILNDAKGSRLTKEQITNCMVMWSSHMIENGKYNYSAHQLHQAFKRWVLRETQYVKQNPAAKAGPDAAPESVTLKTKNFNFQ